MKVSKSMVKNKENLLSKSDVDDRLRRIANILLLNASFIDNLGLLNGKMGIAIFFYQYSRYTKNKIFENYAGELIDEIYKEINRNTPVNFENGLTGIGWGIEYLVKNKFVQAETDEALIEIDTSVYRNSLYRPFLLETGKDLFGYGLYYLARLREHGTDNDNLNALFKKQHLIYLTDDCERILIQKKYLDFNIQSLGIDSINSFVWFLLEMQHWGIFPFKVEKLFHSLPGFIDPLLQNCTDPSAAKQLHKLIEHIIPCIIDTELSNLYKGIYENSIVSIPVNKLSEEDLVNMFIKETWQNLIYDPYNNYINDHLIPVEEIFLTIDNEENWNKRLDNLNKNNLSLTGFAGLGLGLLKVQSIEPMAKGMQQGAEGKTNSLKVKALK